MSMRKFAYTDVFLSTKCYLIVTEHTANGSSEVDRYVISNDATFGDVCFTIDENGLFKFFLVENYKVVESHELENFTIIEYLHGKGLRILDTDDGEHEFNFDDSLNYKIAHKQCIDESISSKFKKNYSLSLLFVMNRSVEEDHLPKKKLELQLPSSKIPVGAFPRGKLTRTFTSHVHNWLTGDKKLKLSVCLPQAKAEGQETIPFILYIRKETNVRIKGIKVELLEDVFRKRRINEYNPDERRFSKANYKNINVVENVYKYELNFTVPNSLDEDGCDDEGYGMDDDICYIVREYAFIMVVYLAFPHENISYKIPLQMDCDPMK